MTESYWKLHIDASSKHKASRVVDKCLERIGRHPLEQSLEKYHKGGFMAIMKLPHDQEQDWPSIIYEMLILGEQLGTGWLLMGSVSDDPAAVISIENQSTSINVPGLSWAEWQIIHE